MCCGPNQDEVECVTVDKFGNVVAFPPHVAVVCCLRYPEDKHGPYAGDGGDELPALEGATTSRKFPDGVLTGTMMDGRMRCVARVMSAWADASVCVCVCVCVYVLRVNLDVCV